MKLATHGILGSSIIWDTDALAFFASTSSTNYVEQIAINYLVTQLKANSLWTLITAIYPFVGGTSTSNSYNLKTLGSHQITFNGTVTHNSNGITTDGSSGYANLNIIPSTHLTLNHESMFLYSRTSAASSTPNEVDMGAAITTTRRSEIIVRNSVDDCRVNMNSTTNGSRTVANTNGEGLFMVSRESSTNLKIFKNGVQIGTTQTSVNNGTLPNISIYLGGRNVSNALSTPVARNYALSGAGAGFSDTEAATFYTIVQQYQTLLGRQV